MQKAAFLDRDNTLVKDDGYFHDPNGIVFMPGAAEALRKLQSAGYLLFVVTNQSGVGRGYFPESDTIAVNEKMADLLAAQGVTLAKTYYCPHAPDANCECRKPKPFLILKAAGEFGIDLAKSFSVGNHITDMEAGRAAGTTTIFIGAEESAKPPSADLWAPDLPTAAERILNYQR